MQIVLHVEEMMIKDRPNADSIACGGNVDKESA